MKLEPFSKAVLQLLGIALFLYALYEISAVITYAIIALYVSILGRPLFRFLQNRTPLGKWGGKTLNAAITLVVILGVVGGLGSLLIPMLVNEFAFLNTIRYDQLIADLDDEWRQLDSVLLSLGINSAEELAEINDTLQNFASVDAISGVVSDILGSLGNVVIGLFSITFITFFLIREQHLAHQFIDWVTPKKHHHKLDALVPAVKRIVTRYSFGILLQITAIFILLSIGLGFIGVEGAIVLALVAAVFNLIPYVGPIIGATLGILLSLGQLYSSGQADPELATNLLTSFYLLLGLFAVVQLLDNVVFQPLIFSNSVGAHPLEIFLVISIAGTLLGIGGMIIAVPSYSILRIVLNTVLDKWSEAQ